MNTNVIEFLEEDFNKLNENFPDHPLLWNPNLLNLAISFEFFEELVNRYCFNIPLIPNRGNNEDFMRRSKAFEAEFFEEYEINPESFVISHYDLTIYTSSEKLYLNLLYRIVYESLLQKGNFREIYLKLKNQWKEFLENDILNVSFIIPMPNIKVVGDIKLIDPQLIIKSRLNTWILDKRESRSISSWKSVLVYQTKIPARLFRSKEQFQIENKRLEHKFDMDWKEKLGEIEEIIFTFYLSEINFPYNWFFGLYPWWIEFEVTEFMKLFKETTGPTIRLTTNQCKDIFAKYPDIVKSAVFRRDENRTIGFHYMQLHNLDFTPDVIFNIFSLFEHLFGDRTDKEIVFKIAFNSSLFLAPNKDTFIDMFKFMKKSYDIRSALSHGGDWEQKIKKIIQNYPEIHYHIDLLEKWIVILNNTLKRVIQRKLENPDILTDINELYDAKNLERKATYLSYLASYYSDIPERSEALKLLIESRHIYDMLEIKVKTKEIEEFIIKLIEKKGLIIFRRELNQVLEELKLISEFSEVRKEEAIELRASLEKFFKKLNREENKLLLPINGTDIMDLYGIKRPSKIIGNILKIISKKIEDGDFSESTITKESLLNYLKEYREEIFELASKLRP